jgi:enoyl-CoA hydratase/carnithine racemase
MQSWLYNHSRGCAQKALLKYGCAWTLRKVIMHERKKDISIVLEKAGIKQGSAQMIGSYQKAVDKVISSLTADELQEAEHWARDWNNRCPPTDIQAE